MIKKAKILFFCMIFVVSFCFSQNPYQKRVNVKSDKIVLNLLPVSISTKKPTVTSPTLPTLLSANFYAAQLGFFCKQEIKFEKITKMPFKFRLGSVEDCDRLEGKKKFN